jgi:thiosulfate/3-mercaptopyruvate sulfurtransferase
MEPHQLVNTLKTKKNLPVIISVGPGALIPGSIAVGSVQEQENLDKLAIELKSLDSSKPVVVYCGCCPFAHCPNVRPTVDMLKKMNFTDFKLLNLPKNIKTDWIDKGYPTIKM